MIALPPVEKHVLACGGGIEVVGAVYCHYLGVVVDEGLGNAVGTESVDNCWDVSVRSRKVVPEKAYRMRDPEVLRL